MWGSGEVGVRMGVGVDIGVVVGAGDSLPRYLSLSFFFPFSVSPLFFPCPFPVHVSVIFVAFFYRGKLCWIEERVRFFPASPGKAGIPAIVRRADRGPHRFRRHRDLRPQVSHQNRTRAPYLPARFSECLVFSCACLRVYNIRYHRVRNDICMNTKRSLLFRPAW